MRWSLLIFTLLLAGGCATSRQTASNAPAREATTCTVASDGDAVAASALVFDPPVTSIQPAPQLARDERGIAAFAGYDEGITTFFYLRVNDRQLLDSGGRGGDFGQYERRAVSETFGVSHR
jgi:hypothetical protein